MYAGFIKRLCIIGEGREVGDILYELLPICLVNPKGHGSSKTTDAIGAVM